MVLSFIAEFFSGAKNPYLYPAFVVLLHSLCLLYQLAHFQALDTKRIECMFWGRFFRFNMHHL